MGSKLASQKSDIRIIRVNCPPYLTAPLFRRRRKNFGVFSSKRPFFFYTGRKKGRRVNCPPYFFKLLVGRGQLTRIILTFFHDILKLWPSLSAQFIFSYFYFLQLFKNDLPHQNELIFSSKYPFLFFHLYIIK